mmetsp:Transcript_146813/g.256136  ORF Transcript_146813/g.256136 Transcript_146813/m.256136 type:complete len:237 (+) Transcript_146813:49-759(+)
MTSIIFRRCAMSFIALNVIALCIFQFQDAVAEDVAVEDATAEKLPEEVAGESAGAEDPPAPPPPPKKNITLDDLIHNMGADLTCSGCSWTMKVWKERLTFRLGKKKMSQEKRREIIEKVIDEGCQDTDWPKQMSSMGHDGNKTWPQQFWDFRELQRKGPPHPNLKMNWHLNRMCSQVCRWTRIRIRDAFIAKGLTQPPKVRFGDFNNWEYWGCIQTMKMCNNTQFAPDEDPEEDEL